MNLEFSNATLRATIESHSVSGAVGLDNQTYAYL